VIEQLESFGLPPTFPEECMPAAGARFIADCTKGMQKRALMKLAWAATIILAGVAAIILAGSEESQAA
jgi:hypothetical protein